MKNLKYVSFFALVFIAVFGSLLLFKVSPDINKASSIKKASDFTIKTFEGKKITLSKLPKDKVIVVNFWASWCPSCREEAADIVEVSNNYKNKTLFIGIGVNDKKEDALAYIKEFKIRYPNGPDEDGSIYKNYGLTGVPETFIIKNGLIYHHIIGSITKPEELSQKIDTVL